MEDSLHSILSPNGIINEKDSCEENCPQSKRRCDSTRVCSCGIIHYQLLSHVNQLPQQQLHQEQPDNHELMSDCGDGYSPNNSPVEGYDLAQLREELRRNYDPTATMDEGLFNDFFHPTMVVEDKFFRSISFDLSQQATFCESFKVKSTITNLIPPHQYNDRKRKYNQV